jgi:hypothetical protein
MRQNGQISVIRGTSWGVVKRHRSQSTLEIEIGTKMAKIRTLLKLTLNIKNAQEPLIVNQIVCAASHRVPLRVINKIKSLNLTKTVQFYRTR